MSISPSKGLPLRVLNEIDVFLEKFYPLSQKAGQTLAEMHMEKAQVRSLENIVVSTRRFSEIINFIKNQAGKEKKDNKWGKAADLLLEQLDQIEQQAKNLAKGDPVKALEIKMYASRGWIRQVVAHYLYKKNRMGC